MNMERKFTKWRGFSNIQHIEKLSEVIPNLQYWFDELNKEQEKLAEENEYLRSENYKDSELAKMKEEVEKYKNAAEDARKDSNRGFPITEEQSQAIRKWKSDHDINAHNNTKHYHGTSGGGYTYEFYPTAIGTIGVCRCDICKKEFEFQSL